jgi:hypothetical protein
MMGTEFDMVVGRRGQSYRDMRGNAMADALWSTLQLPAALFFQPDNVPAHHGAVRIGELNTITIPDEEDGEITATGVLYDGRPGMDRVQPWVAEAMALAADGAIWPSVDPAVIELQDNGDGEASVLRADIPGVTLVSMPAFTGTSITLRPGAEPVEDDDDFGVTEVLADDSMAPEAAALVAAAEAAEAVLIAAANATVREPLPADAFTEPELDGYQPGYRIEGSHIYGHLTNRAACHRSWPASCVTPPESPSNYAVANRYEVTTSAGPLEVGRVTTGLGAIGAGCTCHGGGVIDDHYCPASRSAAAAIAHYDQLHTIADVMIGENESGSVWVAGILRGTLPDGAPRVLQRRVWSGDWRPWGTGSELVEVLALDHAEPGFTHRTKHNAAAFTLIAASGPAPEPAAVFAAGIMSEEDLRATIRSELERERETTSTRHQLAAVASRSALAAITRQ